MAGRKNGKSTSARQGMKSTNNRAGVIVAAVAGVFESLVEKVGLPATILFFIGYFIQGNASKEQRAEIINLFILGHGIRAIYPTILVSLVFIVLLLGDRHVLMRRIHELDIEIARLGQWKTDHQDKQIGGVHHSEGD